MRKGWRIRKLSEVCDLQNGFAFKSKAYVDHSNTLNIRMSNIRPNGNFDPEHNIKYLPDSYADEYKQFLLDDGDLVIAMTDMAGEPKILGLPTIVKNHKGRAFLLNQRVGKLKDFSDDIHIPYLRYYLSSPKIKKYYKSKGAGGLQINISKKDILTADIPVPAIEEQKRIVAILDEAFAGIDTAIANTEKNLANARELFESYLNSVFSKKGDGWDNSLLGEICDVRDGTHDSPKYVEDGIPFVTQKNIRKKGLSFEKIKYITESDHESFYKRSNVAQGDVLVSMIGANRGMACIVDDNRLFSIKNVGLIKANENLNMRFILYYLKTSLAKNYIEAESRGGAQPFIGLGKLRAFPVVTAPISVQNRLVDELDAVHVEVSNLEKIYQQKLNSLNELKQSLLQKAFSGELTAEADKLMNEAVA